MTTPVLVHNLYGYYRAHKLLNAGWMLEDKTPPAQKAPSRNVLQKILDLIIPKAAKI